MKQNFFLPNYEQSVAITKSDDTFYEKQTEVNGVKVSVFNYRLSQHKNFVNPIAEQPEVQAHELRGLTFVHTDKGIERYLMLHKFFNLNQVPGYQYDEVKDFLVSRTQDKCDGSMIRFLNIGGQLVAKTKMDFTNDQCRMALESLARQKLEAFVQATLDKGLSAIFELISPWNQIVLKYNETELRLLQLRDEKTGEYLDIYSHPLVLQYGVKCSDREEVQALHTYIERAKTEENIEGWVLTLSNGQMLKIKTAWYCQLHGLLSENLVRENKIMEMVLTETMDDALSQIDEKDVRRKYSENIQAALVKHLDAQLKEVLALKATYTGDRKEFAMKNLKHPLFSIAAKLLDTQEGVDEVAYKLLKNKTQRETSGLMDAKAFVGNVLKVQIQNLEEVFEDEG